MTLAVAVVTVLLNGRLILSSRPPEIVGGTVMAPLDPFALRIARVASFDPRDGTIVIRRDQHSLTLRVASRAAVLNDEVSVLPFAPYVSGQDVRIPLAAVARALGASVSFDAETKILAIDEPARLEPITTPTPYDSSAPSAAPTVIFTPERTVTPRPEVSGSPVPRRTPLSEDPSWPA